MYFVLLAALATALLLAWWLMRKKAAQKEAVKRLSIAVTEGIALVTLPTAYEVEDMGMLWDFTQGKEAAANRARVHSLLYDCSEWRWSNVLGLEMVLWQAEADWTGDTVFCQLSSEIKAVLDRRERAPTRKGKPTDLSPVPLLCDRGRRVDLYPRQESLNRVINASISERSAFNVVPFL